MNLVRSSLDSSMVFLAVMALLAALLAARAVRAPHRIVRPEEQEVLELYGASFTALLFSGLLTRNFIDQLPVLAVFLIAAAFLRYHVHRLSMPGILWLTVQPLALIISSTWGALFIIESALPAWAERLALLGIGASAVMFALGYIERLAREAVLTHEQWSGPIAPPAPFSSTRDHKVSIQLPCYAEPPEVVKATMDRLAELDYHNCEVLVCDNNTKDEMLWRPLEAHCAVLNQRLGYERFRFFHVDPLPGAKAGALNFLLEVMAPDAELVAIIDADYQARPDFLSRLVTFFDDPKIGYVQTPHDYRGYSQSDYLNACYWEYMPNNKVDMPGVSEYGGAFTIGTMCILRTEGLRRAGGWAEWCLTEDSEVSVRLRKVGYEGVYLAETFGRGLIPETFDDYKKQRFRWTAGPVQQLRRHWKLFLPAPLAPRMPGWTKLLEVLRCIAPLQVLLGMVAGILGLAAVSVAIVANVMDPITIPDVGWVVLSLGGLTSLVRLKHRYRLAGCAHISDMVYGEIARASLSYVILVAGVAGLSSKPLAWRRTPKFAAASTRETPFHTTMPETILGCASLLVGIAALAAGGTIGYSFAFLAFLGAMAMAAQFFCAPYMAHLSIRHVNAEEADREEKLAGMTAGLLGEPLPLPLPVPIAAE